jgi:hypothetical protein
MIVVRIRGGIGNQLFQYSYGEYLRLKTGQEVKYDIASIGRPKKSQTLRRLEIDIIHPDIPVVENIPFSHHRGMLYKLLRKLACWSRGINYIQGYWQKEIYPNELLKNKADFFAPCVEKPVEIQTVENEIKITGLSIALHIRRGDYFSSEKSTNRYGVCDADYYQKAIAFLHQNRKKGRIFVFSDDLDWVKKNITLPEDAYYVPNQDVNSFWYIYLMSCCSHNIISNSSFSWWGAYLNKNKEKIVVCPKRWTFNSNKTIALPDWIKIE